VLLDPYGGPHFQRVVMARNEFLEPQWFADQGFAVIVADGRGTPGRGVAWEKSVYLNFAEPVLEDQIDALHGAAAEGGQQKGDHEHDRQEGEKREAAGTTRCAHLPTFDAPPPSGA